MAARVPASTPRRRCAGTAPRCTCSTRRGCPPRRLVLDAVRRGRHGRGDQRLAVRGAPLIGVAAAYGLAMEVARTPTEAALERGAAVLAGARPTARNLGWAVERVVAAALAHPDDMPAATRADGRGDRARGRGGQRRARPPRRRRARRGAAARPRHRDDALQLRRAGRVRPRHRPRRDRRAGRPPAGPRARLRGAAAAAGRAADRLGAQAARHRARAARRRRGGRACCAAAPPRPSSPASTAWRPTATWPTRSAPTAWRWRPHAAGIPFVAAGPVLVDRPAAADRRRDRDRGARRRRGPRRRRRAADRRGHARAATPRSTSRPPSWCGRSSPSTAPPGR